MKPSGSSLIITDLQSTDGGQYKCTVTGKYNKIEGMVTVNVFGRCDFVVVSNYKAYAVDPPSYCHGREERMKRSSLLQHRNVNYFHFSSQRVQSSLKNRKTLP